MTLSTLYVNFLFKETYFNIIIAYNRKAIIPGENNLIKFISWYSSYTITEFVEICMEKRDSSHLNDSPL